ncbi:hypothetical protein JCM10212_005589 [Sporobolomyces blumeae]
MMTSLTVNSEQGSEEIETLAAAIDAASTSSRSTGPGSTAFATLPIEILSRIAGHVRIPSELAYRDYDDESGVNSPELSTAFLNRSTSLLSLARSVSPFLAADSSGTTIDPSEIAERADIFLRVSRFAQPEFETMFSNIQTKTTARAILDDLSAPPEARLPLLSHLLRLSLPALFRPHPKVNPQSGRVLSRPLGGDRGTSDWQDEAEDGWKREVGVAGVVLEIVLRLRREEVEDLWPLILPPLLSFLDDFTPSNRILGMHILGALLERVDRSLLVRTGVGKVFEQSFDSIFSILSDSHTPRLLELAHPVALSLLRLLYPRPPPLPSMVSSSSSLSTAAAASARSSTVQATSRAPLSAYATKRPLRSSSEPSPTDPSFLHFTAVHSLFSNSVLKSWEFKSGHYEIERVGLEALANGIVDEMGPGAVRWFGVLVPHLCAIVDGAGEGGQGGEQAIANEKLARLRLKAVEVLRLVVRAASGAPAASGRDGLDGNALADETGPPRGAGRVRVVEWTDKIGSSVAKCWIHCQEYRKRDRRTGEVAEAGSGVVERLEQELKALVRDLRGCRPRVADEDADSKQDFFGRLPDLDRAFEPLVRPEHE